MNTYSLDHLTPVQKTLLITLKGRAVDSAREKPILGDPLAGGIVKRLDYDLDSVKLTTGVPLAIVIRSRMLDRAVAHFVQRHPDAVVVELGCGLETRMFRITPPATVDWYDVDFPDVIALRRELLPEHDQAHMIGASVADAGWLGEIPRDRPTVVVADGLFGFLSEDDNRRILTALTDHFTGGEIVFNTYTKLVARMMGNATVRSAGIEKGFRGFGMADPHDVERLNPRLEFVEEQTGATAPEADQLPWPTRMVSRLFAHWPAQARRGVWVVRYRF